MTDFPRFFCVLEMEKEDFFYPYSTKRSFSVLSFLFKLSRESENQVINLFVFSALNAFRCKIAKPNFLLCFYMDNVDTKNVLIYNLFHTFLNP